MSRSSRMVTSRFESRASASCVSSASRGRFFVISFDVLENVLERSIRRDQLACRLVADAFHTRNVVGRIADHREIVGDVMRRDAQPLVGVLQPDPLLLDTRRAAAPRIEKPHAGTHELVEVLVARDDDDVHAGVDALSGKRADHVIGFISIECEHAHVECGQQFFDALHAAIEIRLQLFAELLARGLVGGILLVSEGQSGIVHPADVLGPMRVDEALEKIDHAPCGGMCSRRGWS